MASSRRTTEEGFATPAATVVSLAIAIVMIAAQARATMALRQAQADYRRSAAEMALDAAQTLAAADLVDGARASLSSLQLDRRTISIRLEAEAAKLSLADAAKQDPGLFSSLGARNPNLVKAGLASLAQIAPVDPARIDTLDPSPKWRACGRSVLSPYGAATAPARTPSPPQVQGHPGEVWRVLAISSDGWTDDRTVRITGGQTQTARVIYRSFRHEAPGAPSCPSPLAAHKV